LCAAVALRQAASLRIAAGMFLNFVKYLNSTTKWNMLEPC